MSQSAIQIDPPGRAGRDPSDRSGGRRRRLTGLLVGVGRVGVLAGLLGLTAWNVTRSTALERAEAAYRRGDVPTALGAALDHLDRRPWSRPAHRLAAVCLSRLDFAEEAEPHYRRAGPLAPDDRHARALGLVRANRREEALAAYRQILEADPGDALALRRMGAELMTMSRWKEALEVAERLADTPEGEVEGLAMIGAIHHHADHFEEAAAAYAKVLEVDPDLTRLPASRDFRLIFWGQLGHDLIRAGRPEEARRHLERALGEWDHPGLVLLLGRAYHRLGDLDEAERVWRKALAMDPRLGGAWLELGRLILARPGAEAPSEALPYLERAEALDPTSFEPSYSLALAYRRLGRPEDAKRALARSEAIRRRHPPPPSGMGAHASPLP